MKHRWSTTVRRRLCGFTPMNWGLTKISVRRLAVISVAACGAITAGLMVLGAKGVDSPMAVKQFRKEIAEKHDGMTDCADLLRANAQKGGDKKTHCDKMIQEAIELADKLIDEKQ